MRGEKRPVAGSIAAIGADHTRAPLHIDCFADEVVIDFPSVAPAVERIRRAFVDEGPRPSLAAELSLTPRQAFEGATVPLDVPVRCTCRDCGGRGETWPDPCERCYGTGVEYRQHQVQVSVPARVAAGTRFHFSVARKPDPPTYIELHVSISS